jgi:hypothetical protein
MCPCLDEKNFVFENFIILVSVDITIGNIASKTTSFDTTLTFQSEIQM